MRSNRGARDAGDNPSKVPVVGKIKPGRIAWLELPTAVVAVNSVTPEEQTRFSAEADNERISLTIRKRTSRSAKYTQTSIDLTFLTEAELKCFLEIVQHACELALPECQRLDRNAKEAYENGDDSFARLYRPVPEVFKRNRKSRQHSEGVHDGPSDADELEPYEPDDDSGIGSAGSELSE